MCLRLRAAVDEDEPNLLLVGMHHAREIMGPETVLLAAKRLLEGEGAAVREPGSRAGASAPRASVAVGRRSSVPCQSSVGRALHRRGSRCTCR